MEAKLSTLAAGHGGDFLVRSDFQFINQIEISVPFPVGVKTGVEFFYLADIHKGVLYMSFNQIADAPFGGRGQVLCIFPVNQALAGTGFQKAVQDVDCGTFSGSVFSQ